MTDTRESDTKIRSGMSRRTFFGRTAAFIGVIAAYTLGLPRPANAIVRCWSGGAGYMTSHDYRAHWCQSDIPNCGYLGHEYWKRFRNGTETTKCCGGDTNGCTGLHSCYNWYSWLQYVSATDCGCGCS